MESERSSPPERRGSIAPETQGNGTDMNEAAYVAVDWGTSSFRLWLMGRSGEVLAERRSDEGMMAAGKAGFAAVLQAHLDAIGAAAKLPVIICGMAGARQGWVEAGYVDTPAPLAAVLQQAVVVPGQARDIRILPGIAQRDRGAPDVMRGEETQLLGLDVSDDALVCMPGTDSKWVSVGGGSVQRFTTFMTGELFDMVSRHTILSIAVSDADEADDVDAFKSAVAASFEQPALAANLLFRVRAGQLLFGGAAAAARETISGTLIGLELAGGLVRGANITLVASGRLARLYQLAFDAVSVPVRSIGAEEATRRGLAMAAKSIWSI